MALLDYDTKRGLHRSAVEEWAPHKSTSSKFIEWHYITFPMIGANGHLYFLFLCNFHMTSAPNVEVIDKNVPQIQIPEGKEMYLNASHFCDYSTDLFKDVAIPTFVSPEEVFDKESNTLKMNAPFKMDFNYQGDRLSLKASLPIYDLQVEMTGGNRVLWAKDKLGIEGFIQEGAEDDRSFYYSLPKLPFHGTLQYAEKDGTKITTDVYGQGWIDRQWGDYLTKSWEWSSLRFADGDRVNLYNFPGGHQVGSYQHEDGTCEYFPKFTVIQNGYSKTDPPVNIWFSFGWSYRIPVKDGYYTVEPLSRKNVLVSPGNTLFEGLGRLLDRNGQQIGWAVNESMDVRVMNNAPYQQSQNF
jgi:hypothetical protein